jgi:hypothetical protein
MTLGVADDSEGAEEESSGAEPVAAFGREVLVVVSSS